MRTPSSASLEYARCKVEKAAELARQMPETEGHQQPRQRRAAAASTWTSARAPSASARPAEICRGAARASSSALVGAEYVVLDDLNNGAQKPVQIQFYGPDSRKLMEITNDFMDKMRKIPGAVDVGLSEQDPKDELRIELDRGLANQLGISVNDAAQALRVAFAGVEVGDWVDPDRRIARRRGAPASRRPRRRLATSSTCRSPWPAPT